jgi:hypothetical protein
MTRKNSASPTRKRSAQAKIPSRKKPQRLNKNQRSAKKMEGRVAQIGAAAALLADPKTNPKLKALIRKQLPAKGRAERIARAEKAWKIVHKLAAIYKNLDIETIKWLAEDPDLYP